MNFNGAQLEPKHVALSKLMKLVLCVCTYVCDVCVCVCVCARAQFNAYVMDGWWQ